ncbi:hypothetical protein PAHAL_4G228900 [Panicum hallii]|uniref:MPN domain-containing protein n=1 Tax=Panicum hallii TaxID=206008 RepID=A0A2T8JDS9_9POAL|nr:26S proteasome non-ATPase regulatory subunit 14 homolog [Panicum hallii]PVH48055.1 hypothetical protein PAHAL_4G228900 [Panicum hallii]
MVVGWYHSHPGFGCWLSGVDIKTQQSFEALNPRAVAAVIDPIQSMKGKVVIDAFRLINPQTMMLGQEPQQTTSNVGHLNKPSFQALIHGLNRHYYSIAINYRKNELEEMLNLAIKYNKAVQEEDELPRETCQSECRSAGCKEAFGRACVKFDVVKHSSDLGTMLDTIVF